jgi:hypothetical protein
MYYVNSSGGMIISLLETGAATFSPIPSGISGFLSAFDLPQAVDPQHLQPTRRRSAPVWRRAFESLFGVLSCQPRKTAFHPAVNFVATVAFGRGAGGLPGYIFR